MNLPVFLDIAIGLLFIYLILSLLASEIQELISTIFQWRAEHLKKFIEILLSGDRRSSQEERVVELANKLYDNPLIKNINQEAKGLFATLPRLVIWSGGYFYRQVINWIPGTRKNESVFGGKKHSGPSYIDSETFATTLLETLKIPTLSHKIGQFKLKEFKNERVVSELQNILSELKELMNGGDEKLAIAEIDGEFQKLKWQLDKIFTDYKNGKATLATSLDRMEEKLNIYIASAREHLDSLGQEVGQNFIRQMQSLKNDIFGSTTESNKTEKIVLLAGLKPTMTEVVETYRIYRQAKKEIRDVKETNSPSYQRYQELKNLYEEIEDVIELLPESVVDSLTVLAKRAQTKARNAEEDINQLRQEVETWFDRSMDRASGVYKRNAKGVAILIGFFIAVAANADTLHIADRLSKDSILRDAVILRAGDVNSLAGDLESVKDQVSQALQEVPVPLGWDSYTLLQQDRESKGWQYNGISFAPLKKFFGWVLSAIAIAMGAPFWFDLLNRVVNVRNAGKPPKSSDEK